MTSSVFCLDPTLKDEQSKARGIGRYLQLLKESFEGEWTFGDRQQISNMKPSIVINSFFNLLDPQAYTQKLAKKQIAVIYDLIPLKYPKAFPIGLRGKLNVFRNKRGLSQYDLIVTDSEESKKDIVRMLKIDEKKVKVIYPTLPTSFIHVSDNNEPLELAFQPPLKYCLYVGDATWNKNLLTLAKAVKQANVTCVMVGKVFTNNQSLDHPWQKDLRGFFQEVRGDKRFLFAGFVPDKQLIKLYKQSMLNILLSRDEGFGFSFLEAAQLGCPSVLGDIPVFRETAGEAALFANPSDPTEAANKIQDLYFDDNRRQLMGLKAQDRAKAYSSENFKNGWRSLILP